jgi:thiamine pyrophosphate-dependent acetolactate synthase large subunit-like protein
MAAATLVHMPEEQRSTAELIVECLANEGVTHVFGIPGEENIRLRVPVLRTGMPVIARVPSV